MNPIRFSKILIVDDSNAFRAKIQRLLTEGEIGYFIYEARDGGEGFSMYKKYRPHVVIMDIMMPKVNGIESMKKIIEFDPDAKIIVTSTKENKETIDAAIKSGGAKDYIIKPFHSGVVLMAVSKQLLVNRDYRRSSTSFITDVKKPLMHNGITHGHIEKVFEDGELEMKVDRNKTIDELLEKAQEIKDMGEYFEIVV
ncbi:MAG: response regulator [Nitrosopumilus sp.]